MADERYEWLDKETAERLLRGEPVGALDERARTQAARLNRALHSVARPRLPGYPDDGEMPGEAAATAAFRKARADARATGGQNLGIVRLAAARRSSSGWGRPVRFGVVAVVAGFAFGGVAVASGSGLLPSPFGGSPGPRSTVSANPPGPLASESPQGRAETPPGAVGPSPPIPSQSGGPGSEGSDTDPPGPKGKNGRDKKNKDKKKQRKAELHQKTLDACREYRSGTIDPERRRRLEITAKGESRVDQFCDKLLRKSDGDGDNGDTEKKEKKEKKDKDKEGEGGGNATSESNNSGNGNGNGNAGNGTNGNRGGSNQSGGSSQIHYGDSSHPADGFPAA
ncbi:hypothetical protein ACFYT4_11195 [Streptomyces sp. NPDC004609]|uniref:hypothetical protein n=1 Tax=Streptomyces sp. NPDC004609 TaxID=3364704 RepID=UPI0036B51E26